jgi:hypothetical protein
MNCRVAGAMGQTYCSGCFRLPANSALKLTRLSGCLRGEPGFGEDPAVQWPCPSSAAQVSAGV